MTAINDIADLVRILQDNPAWAEAVRSVLLSQELLKMPEEFANFARTVRENSKTVNLRLARLENDVSELKTGQARLENDVSELKTGQARLENDVSELKTGQARLENGMDRMRGEIGNLTGADFQRRAAGFAVRIARRDFYLQRTTLIHQSGQTSGNSISSVLDEAVENGSVAFSEDDAANVEQADAVVVGEDQNGSGTYLVVEASVTVMEKDVARARERADLLEQATGTATEAVVIGTAITGEAARQAREQRVTFVQFDPRGAGSVQAA